MRAVDDQSASTPEETMVELEGSSDLKGSYTGIRSCNFTMQSRNYDFSGESPPNCAGASDALLSEVTALR